MELYPSLHNNRELNVTNTGHTVLVADGAAERAAILAHRLSKQGYQVLSARDGREALEVAAADHPDVILLAVGLPRTDGIAVCKRLKFDEKLRHIPVVLVSENNLDEDVLAGMDAGADDYVVMPLGGEALAARLRLVLRIKENHDVITQINQRLRKEIADRKRVEEEITSLRQHIEFILGATKAGLAIVDTRMRITHVDPLLRKTHGDPGLNKCRWYFGCGRGECARCAVRKAMDTGEVAVSEQTLPKDNNRPVKITSIPFRDGHGCWLYAAVIVDISERKALERDLSQAQELEVIGQLAAGIAHEINTPIQYVGDNTRFLQDAFGDISRLLSTIDIMLQEAKGETLEQTTTTDMRNAVFDADIEYLSEEIPVAIRQSLEGVDHVAGIVRAMKELSHLGGEELTPVDLNHVIENTLTISRNEWKYVADLVTDFDPDLPLVPCLPGDINQVILNLVVNAAQAIAEATADHTRGKGIITVRTRREGNYVSVRVEDTGTGISEHIRDRIFEPFFTTKGVGKGTGQGLSIVRSVVEKRLGGTIGFETEVNQRTAFIIRIPIVTSEQAESDLDTPKRPRYGTTLPAGSDLPEV